MYVVILAGGSGTRFWPVSRHKSPKQLMSLFGEESMLQRTVKRILPLNPKRVIVITNEVQADQTTRQLDGYSDNIPLDIIAEPIGRNTAPAIGLAAKIIDNYDPSSPMLVLPADHFIRDDEKFRNVIKKGVEAAGKGGLITIGMEPTRPETGYGYIEAETVSDASGVLDVKRFVEKPGLTRATEFLAAKNFYWNSGMFIWRSDVILAEIAKCMKELSIALHKLKFPAHFESLSGIKPQIELIYNEIKGESIDYGVMEHAENVKVIPASFGWSDVGSWGAVPEVIDKDINGMVAINAKELISVNSRDCTVYSDRKVVALVGVEDLVVVSTSDAILVSSINAAQDVKKVVDELKAKGLEEYL
ncbi:MAG: sugar phosphate nucleotidyltransferase [Desulfuromonadales bacterium]|nr:sugar phosphate nucleotidyltransferase [Desulfuromonadales bacterium]